MKLTAFNRTVYVESLRKLKARNAPNYVIEAYKEGGYASIINKYYRLKLERKLKKQKQVVENTNELTVAKKPVYVGGIASLLCPNCSKIVFNIAKYNQYDKNCKYCGQKLDWSEYITNGIRKINDESASDVSANLIKEAVSNNDLDFIKAFFMMTNMDIISGKRLPPNASNLIKQGIVQDFGLKDLFKKLR